MNQFWLDMAAIVVALLCAGVLVVGIWINER